MRRPGAVVLLLGAACAAPAPRPGPVAVAPAPVVAPAPAPPVAASPPTVEEEPELPPRASPDADFRARPPAPGPERPFRLPAIKRFRLANGLPVVLVESHALPLVSLELVVRSGNGAAPRDNAGLASVTAALLEEGTSTRSALELSQGLARLGASQGARASWDASSVSLSALTDKLDPALELWADLIQTPRFDEADVARIRDDLAAAALRRRESPPQVADAVFARALFGEAHPYGAPDPGTAASLGHLTAEDVRRFHQAHFRPGNATLIAAGDVTEATLRPRLDALWKGWRPAPAPPTPRTSAPPPPAKTTIVLVDRPGGAQVSVRVGLVGLDRRSPDYHRAAVLNELLGGSFRRLDLSLRQEKGWALSVRSSFDARRTPGPWVVRAELLAQHTVGGVAEILRVIRALRDGELTDRELAETKAELVRGFPARFATARQTAAQLAAAAVHGLPDGELAAFPARIAAVTATDVRRMAEKYLPAEKLVVVVVGDWRQHEAGLARLGDVELRDPDGAPLAVPVANAPQ